MTAADRRIYHSTAPGCPQGWPEGWYIGRIGADAAGPYPSFNAARHARDRGDWLAPAKRNAAWWATHARSQTR